MKDTAIIRDRGQLTIPDSIRKVVSWVAPLSAVTISMEKPDEIVIRPHQASVDWDLIWKNIRRSRAITGKGRGSALHYIKRDRNSH